MVDEAGSGYGVPTPAEFQARGGSAGDHLYAGRGHPAKAVPYDIVMAHGGAQRASLPPPVNGPTPGTYIPGSDARLASKARGIMEKWAAPAPPGSQTFPEFVGNNRGLLPFADRYPQTIHQAPDRFAALFDHNLHTFPEFVDRYPRVTSPPQASLNLDSLTGSAGDNTVIGSAGGDVLGAAIASAMTDSRRDQGREDNAPPGGGGKG